MQGSDWDGCVMVQGVDVFGPEKWTGYPDRLRAKGLLFDPENIRINGEGYEVAVGAFEF